MYYVYFHYLDLYTVLMSACSKTGGNESDILKCIELLIQKGADVNAFDRYSNKSEVLLLIKLTGFTFD